MSTRDVLQLPTRMVGTSIASRILLIESYSKLLESLGLGRCEVTS